MHAVRLPSNPSSDSAYRPRRKRGCALHPPCTPMSRLRASRRRERPSASSIPPPRAAWRAASWKSGATHRNRVRRSGPPSVSAKQPMLPVGIDCRISPPGAMRTARWPTASANQTAPSASSTAPSGAAVRLPSTVGTSVIGGCGPHAAQSRRGPRPPSACTSKAEMRLPMVSQTISVRPSGVSMDPLGKYSPSAATDTVPSGSTRASRASAGAPPPMRSKPKLPT